MNHRHHPLVRAGTLALLAIGCERAGNHPVRDTPAPPGAPSRDSSVIATPGSGWRDEDGPLLIIAGGTPYTGAMVFPGHGDTATLAIPETLVSDDHLIFALLGRAGMIGRARLTGGFNAPDTSCETWPTARLAPVGASSDSAKWSVAFVERTADGIALDSIERLARGDSARLVADLARLASGLPNDTVAAFRGLPFNVRGAWRFPVGNGITAVVAEISRRVAQEANQREERLFVVAERDTAPGSRWSAAFNARVTGTEETVDAIDLLAVARLGHGARLVIVVSHETVHGAWYEIIARDAEGQWQRQWRSPPAGC